MILDFIHGITLKLKLIKRLKLKITYKKYSLKKF